MKKYFIGLSLVIAALLSFSCNDEPKPATYVWGVLSCGSCGAPFEVDGTLGRKGKDYYGWCTNTDTGIKFTVGQGNPQSSDFSDEYFFQVVDIVGPPSIGAYGKNGLMIDDPDAYTVFDRAQVRKTNVWNFDYADTDPKQCYVMRFAEPAKKEVTPTKYGSLPFEYYVNIQCIGLDDIVSQNDQPLRSLNIELWFDNCE